MSGARRQIVVVGGGIAGLGAAHRIAELVRERNLPATLSLLEAGGRLGGTIATEQRDGFLLESGPDSFISEKPWALALCRRVGLEPRLLGTADKHRTTFVVHRGRLEPLPDGFALLAPTRIRPVLFSRLFSWSGKLRMALDLVLPRAGQRRDESLGSFVRRRLGKEALERVAQPLVGGIYTADPDRLSLAATLPRFLQMEREHRSLIYAMWRARRNGAAGLAGSSGARWGLFVTLRGGMEELVTTLARRLPEGSIRCGSEVTALRQDGAKWRVELGGGETLAAEGVVLATPSFVTARLVRPFDPVLGERLGAIPYSSAATVSLAFHRQDIRHPLDGFGFVVPRGEKRSIIACTFSSVKYEGRAPAGCVLLRAFVGGAMQEHLLALSDVEMEETVLREIASLLGTRASPLFTRISRHPRAMPQYLVGHLDLVEEIEGRLSRYPGLALAGSAYRGVGISDCVRGAEAAAEAVLARSGGEGA